MDRLTSESRSAGRDRQKVRARGAYPLLRNCCPLVGLRSKLRFPGGPAGPGRAAGYPDSSPTDPDERN